MATAISNALPGPSTSLTPTPCLDAEVSFRSSEQQAIALTISPVGVQAPAPTYHEDGTAPYCLPNEQVYPRFKEHVRLETQAKFLSKMMSDKVLHAPVDSNAARILDIGCGTGIVTHLMAEAFPQASCIGLDLSTTPGLRPCRANVRFFQGNAATQKPTQWKANDGRFPLPQDEHLFDYVFSRLLILGMSDWPNFIRKEFLLLKPGGWAEVHDLAWDWYDLDGSIVSDQWSWLRVVRGEFENRKGMDLACGNKAKAWMQEAGYVDVQVYRYTYPFCGSSESSMEMREFGRFNAAAIPAVLETSIPRAMGILDTKADEAMRAEMLQTLLPGKQRYQIFYVTIGRKPDHAT